MEPVPAETVPDPVAKAASGWDVDEDCEGWGDGGGWGCIVETAPAAAFGAFAAPKSSEDAVDTGLPDISSLSVADCEHVPALVPVSLEWYDEPPGRSDALDAKARALLDKYLKEGEPEEVESLRISLIGGRVLSPCGDSGHSEGHERLSATDKCALKFQDTIARAPTQCVRQVPLVFESRVLLVLSRFCRCSGTRFRVNRCGRRRLRLQKNFSLQYQSAAVGKHVCSSAKFCPRSLTTCNPTPPCYPLA